MDAQFLEVECPLSVLREQQLKAMVVVSATWAKSAEAVAACLAFAAQEELSRRRHNARSNETIAPGDGIKIDFARWSDRDVGDAVLWCTAMAGAIEDPSFGELVDALTKTIAIVATHRLANSADTRNATTFCERNGLKFTEGPEHDPSLN